MNLFFLLLWEEGVIRKLGNKYKWVLMGSLRVREKGLYGEFDYA